MGILQDNRTLITAAATGCGLIAGLYFYKKYIDKKNYWNSEFVHVGDVHELNIYPVKSCKGIKTDWLDCTNRGAKFNENRDRQFLLIDTKIGNSLITGRQHSKLVVVQTFVQNGILTITTPENETINIVLDDVIKRNDVKTAVLFENLKQDGYDCGDEVSEFFGKYLGTLDRRNLRLLYYVEGLKTERDLMTDQSYWTNPVPELQDTPAFQDEGSFMLCTEASVEELNKRLAESDTNSNNKVDMRYFRPIINVSNTLPHDEDRWLHVRIGEVEFACYKPCTRCAMTAINPDTGINDSSLKTLKFLRTYRKAPGGKLLELYKESPVFGVLLSIIKPGRIHIGDKVYARYKPSAL